MAKKSSRSGVVAAGGTPLSSAAGSTLQWNAKNGRCHDGEVNTPSAERSVFQATGSPLTKFFPSPCWTTGEIEFAPGLSLQAVTWEQEAARATFSLASALLRHIVHAVPAGVTGELVWVPWLGQTTCPRPGVRPVLLIHTPYEALQTERLTLVPYFPTSDPLLDHITLLLRTAVEGESAAGQLYAQSLADALAVHFLRRYHTTEHPLGEVQGGLSPYKLRRMKAYIEAHLEQELSLATLAAVGETSPAHFSRLFKYATGLAPHQYVITCRIERAKHLLAETNLGLTDIALLVGCSDHSHFSALFRAHTAQTPTAYRCEAQNAERGTVG
ncbi:MAG: helix-turn-helix domain-containing protein [Candidatus Binatia bacterium]